MTEPKMKSVLSEVTAKAASLFAAVYGMGFLVVTIRLGEFGVLELNPLRPQILLVGALFALLAAVPIFVAFKSVGLFRTEPVNLPGMKPIERTKLYRIENYISFFIIALGLAAASGPAILSESLFFPESRWFLFVLIPILISVGVTVLARYRFDKLWHVLIGMSLLSSGTASIVVFLHGARPYFWLTVWYYLLGCGTLLLYSSRHKLTSSSAIPWEYLPFWLLAIVTLYSTRIYPAARPQVGGGRPDPSSSIQQRGYLY